jgi:hypothetical protein
MKKIFTLVAMATLAFSANAQTESAFINLNVVSEAAVDKDTAEPITAGTELCSTTNVTMRVAYDDTYARIALWGVGDAVNTVSIDGVSYDMPMGLQGQTNPKENTLKNGGQQLGAVFQFDVKADGYLYVFGKFAANKNYYVWEGDVVNSQAMPVAYTMAAALASDGTPVGYTLPGNAEGYYTIGGGYDDATKYLAADQCTEIFKVDGITSENVPGTKTAEITVWKGGGNALGVIAFPVYAEGEKYFVNACGSKVTVNGYVFVKGATQIGTVTCSKGETAGISGIAAANVAKKAAKKALVNGRLVIEKDGKQFSVAGAQVK